MRAPQSLLGDDRPVHLAEAGSKPAFAAIDGRCAGVLDGHCRAIVGDWHAARDASHNAMLKAFVALRRQRGPLRPWLFRIARTSPVSLLRRALAQMNRPPRPRSAPA